MARISVIAAPYHAGAYGIRVGSGPLRLLKDGLIARLEEDGHEVTLEQIAPVDDFEGEIGKTFEIKRRVADKVAGARADKAFPLVVAGNCNVEVGVWAGIAPRNAGLIWFDAHADFDTPDEHRSGYLDGMGVATMAGQCWHAMTATVPRFQPFDLGGLLYCGIRDFSDGQLEKVQRFGVAAVVGRLDGCTAYVQEFTRMMSGFRHREVMIHLDVDCLDTSVGIANEYAAPGGLSLLDLDACVRCACAAARPLSLTIASFNAELSGADRISAAAIDTARTVAAAV